MHHSLVLSLTDGQREPIKKNPQKIYGPLALGREYSCTSKQDLLKLSSICHYCQNTVYNHMKGKLEHTLAGTFKVQNHISPKKKRRVHFEDKTLTPNSLS
jgi:hypothetical protein